MSVVAGCLLVDGVLLAADTRITYSGSDGSKVYADNAIKIFPFAAGTAIGYAGTVKTASILLEHLIAGRDRDKRTHPMRLRRWIPRLLRSAYRRLPAELQMQVSFMVASSFRDTPTTLNTPMVGRLLFEAVKSGMTSTSGTLAWDIITSGKPQVQIPNTCRGMLYKMSSPNFEPTDCPPLNLMAIGSGMTVVEDMQKDHAQTVLSDMGSPLEAALFRLRIKGFIEHHEQREIDSVGGLYPVLKVRGNVTIPLGFDVQTHKQGSGELEAHVTLSIEEGKWVQREQLSGVSIVLKPPWELLKGDPKTNVIFDYIDRRRWRKQRNDTVKP